MTVPDFQFITDGVRCIPVRTPTLPPATHTNVWILGEHHVTVVDPGSPYPDEQERLDYILETVLVERIVLTHHHADHISGAIALKSTTGARIAAHPLTQQRIDFDVDDTLTEDDVLATDAGFWRVFHTPGHASGHICLHNPGISTLVMGDMVAGIGTILLDPPEGDLGLYLHSLNLLRDLQPKRLLPAHGPVIDNAVGCLNEYINHRHTRTEQIAKSLAEIGTASPLTIANRIYGTQVPDAFMPVAARQVLTHLNWLVAQNRAIVDNNKQFSAKES